MPKADPLEPATAPNFQDMRLRAMFARKNDALRAESNDALWADYGRAFYANLMNNDRFLKAVVTAMIAAEAKDRPGNIIVAKLKCYLTTGVIG